MVNVFVMLVAVVVEVVDLIAICHEGGGSGGGGGWSCCCYCW